MCGTKKLINSFIHANGDSTLTTHLHFTKKKGFSMLNVCPGAHLSANSFVL